MAEGRKIADKVKNEENTNIKKMKIGGVETEVTLKSNIGRNPGFRNMSKAGSKGRPSLGNGTPYVPFPISALPKEAAAQLQTQNFAMNVTKGETEDEKNAEKVAFDVDSYKKFNFAKLPVGGLEVLKINFLESTAATVTRPAQTGTQSKKPALQVLDITNT